MLERDSSKRLSGRIVIDDAYLGAYRRSVRRLPQRVYRGLRQAKPRLRLRRRQRRPRVLFRRHGRWMQPRDRQNRLGTASRKDARLHPAMAPAIARFAIGAACLLARLGRHRSRQLEAVINRTYRSLSAMRVPRYFVEFEYRFNRRYVLAAIIIPRSTWASVRTHPRPGACSNRLRFMRNQVS